MIWNRFVLVIAMLLLSNRVMGADPWEAGFYGSDNSELTVNVLWPWSPPQRHDLASVGGVADQDWMRISTESNRSYEVAIHDSNLDWASPSIKIELFATDGLSLVQSGANVDLGGYRRALRWIHSGPAVARVVKVTGHQNMSASDFYEISLRETTLYCPRYNNSGGQVSVLIVQRAANERHEVCSATAYFYNESTTVVGSFPMVVAGDNSVIVTSLPGVGPLNGTKGAAHIAHTCGLGGIKAKLVALEPATGFSFDTPCTVREF